MNCQTFEPALNDLARGQMMDAAVRESALEHASACERCGARLAAERALSFNLRAFASSLSDEAAPARAEAQLLTAFRQRHANPETAKVLTPAPELWHRWAQWAAAAAASIATVIGLQAFRLYQPQLALHSAVRIEDTRGLLPSVAPSVNQANEPVETLAVKDGVTTRDEATTPARFADRMQGRTIEAAGYIVVSNRRARSQRDVQPGQADGEIVTDFIPLTYGAAMGANEDAQLVRVELPRSALVSMGLPVDVERTGERVKADVLLGHDGLARAIRFVR